jgi:hypothetical protein
MSRSLWLLPAALFIPVMLIAIRLTPDPAGMGTHLALGLPPCPLKFWTGVFCPACGLTTSFSHIVRGQFGPAWQAHPLGPLLFLLFAWVSLVSLLEFLNFPTFMGRFLKHHWTNLAYGGVFLFLAIWVLRLISNYNRVFFH